MSEIQVQFESLLQGQAGIAQTYSRLTATLEQLEQQLQPMIQSWTGAAQESYLQCKKQWDEAAANLASVLNSIGQAVGQAHENYRAAENSAQSNWT
jgi:6 kDa early secretory antigenic target